MPFRLRGNTANATWAEALGNGSAVAPTHTFTNATNTGMYYNGNVSFSSNGTAIAGIVQGALTAFGNINVSKNASFAGVVAGNTALQITAANVANISIGGTSRFGISSRGISVAGNVDIPGMLSSRQPYIWGGFSTATATSYIPLSTSYSYLIQVSNSTRLYAPIAGRYMVGFNCILNTTTGRNDVHIILNGVGLALTLSEDNLAGYHYRSATTVVYLNTTDYISFQVSTAGTILQDVAWSNFWMVRTA